VAGSNPELTFWTDPRTGTEAGAGTPVTKSGVRVQQPTLDLVAPSDDPDAPAVFGTGDRLAGRYLLGTQIADGGMGTVWSAVDVQTGDEVVVKLMSVDLLDNEEAVMRFEQEADVVASIQSPHVVRFVDYGIVAGAPFIVLERLTGEDLEGRLGRGPLPLSECAHLLEQIAHALLAAHVKGVIHRDVKPANIFLAEQDGRETVKLLDFGVAKLREGARIHTGAGVTVGSPEFMSPEQVQGNPRLDGRSDLFALGSLIYTCVTGKMPFAGAHVADTFQRILRGAYTPPSELMSELPPSIDRFFRKALATDAQDRFQNAAEMAAEFREVVETARIMSRPPAWRAPQALGVPSTTPPPAKRKLLDGRKKHIVASAAAILALIGAALATSVWVGSASEQASEQASPQPSQHDAAPTPTVVDGAQPSAK